MRKCRYKMKIDFPELGIVSLVNRTLCNAYHSSKRQDGLEWGHFPKCCHEKCPLENPELLEGAILSRRPC